jgi:hypothetical protein
VGGGGVKKGREKGRNMKQKYKKEEMKNGM